MRIETKDVILKTIGRHPIRKISSEYQIYVYFNSYSFRFYKKQTRQMNRVLDEEKNNRGVGVLSEHNTFVIYYYVNCEYEN